jgi:eukaryotic-like serine/threonine-protein kinase
MGRAKDILLSGAKRRHSRSKLPARRSAGGRAKGLTDMGEEQRTVPPEISATAAIPAEAPTSVHEQATLPPRPDATVGLAALGSPSFGPSAAPNVRYFGDYEIIREIARGGMGVVFQARQVKLNRAVALKMILAGNLADDTDVKRFHTEAEAAANLDHPGIVPIYEVGQHNGQHFFSMGFVDGESLSHRLSGGPLPPREAAVLMSKVADAIDYAHGRGVIHRDLKPANILIDQNGNPRVTDFGLAKKVESNSSLTASGQIMGTPSYMPPEQAGGRRREVGAAADVYALGATFYALLTGRPPFQAATTMDTVLQVLSDEPVSPRRLNRSVPRDLETIALKCLRKNPSRRYESARALADDLRRWLSGVPILARPTWLRERVIKWVRRRPAVAISGVIGLLALAACVGLALQSKVASDEHLLARSLRYDAQINLANQAWQGFRVDRVEPILEECDPELRGWEWNYMKKRCHADLRTISTPARRALFGLAMSNDGSRMVAADGYDVHIWDPRDQTPRDRRLRHERVSSIALSADGASLVSANGSVDNGGDRKAILWDLDKLQPIRELRPSKPALARSDATVVALHPNAGQLAWASGDGAITIWDLKSGAELGPVTDHAGQVAGLTYSPDGKRLAWVSLDKKVRVWDLAAGRELRSFNVKEPGPLAFSPDGSQLAVTRPLRVWNLADGREAVALDGHAGLENAIAFCPSGDHLATSRENQAVSLYSVGTGEQILMLKGHTAAATGVAFDRSGPALYSCSRNGDIKAWSVTLSQPFVKLVGPIAAPVSEQSFQQYPWNGQLPSAGCLSFSPDGKTLATPQSAKTIALWDAETGKLIRSLSVSGGPMGAVSFSPDGSQIATIGALSQVGLWNPVTGMAMVNVGSQPGNASLDRGVVFSPDGKRLASFSNTSEVTVWDARSGRKLATLVPEQSLSYVTALAYSPDGRHIASCHDRSGVFTTLWDAATFRQVWQRDGAHQSIQAIAFSPDGLFVTMAFDAHVEVCAVASGATVYSLLGHHATVRGVCYSPDGRRIASASHDGTVRLWDTTSGLELITLESTTRLLCVAFSPEGRRVASAGIDGLVRIWDCGR